MYKHHWRNEICFKSFPSKPRFLRVFSTSLSKTLVTLFPHSVFYPFGELPAIFIKFEIVVCKLFHFWRVSNLSSGKELRKVEDIVGNRENAGLQDLLLFPQCFPKACFSWSLRVRILWEKIKHGVVKNWLSKLISHFPFLSLSGPAWPSGYPVEMAQWWAFPTHDLVVVSLIPGWGKLFFRCIFASHLCRSMWEK